MAPELHTVASLPETRLKAVVQANALFEALVAAACFVASEKVARLLALPSPTFAVLIGFSFSFASAFLFRIAMKQPIPSRFVVLIATANFASAVALSVVVSIHLLHSSRQGSAALSSVAGIHACLGVAQVALLSYSSHTYQQPEAVAV